MAILQLSTDTIDELIHSIQPTSLVIFTLGGLAFHNARSISTSPLLRILLGLTLGFSIAFSIFVYVCYLLFPRDNGIGRNAAIFAVISGAISFSMVTEGILSFVQRYMEWLMAIKYGGYPAGVLFIVFCSALGVAWVFAYDVLKSENTQRFVKYFIQMSAALVMLVSIEAPIISLPLTTTFIVLSKLTSRFSLQYLIFSLFPKWKVKRTFIDPEDYEELCLTTTERELDALASHLRQNASELKKISDSNLIMVQRFAKTGKDPSRN